MQASFWDSFPQLFVKGEFIGGYQVLEEFFRSGEYSRARGDVAGSFAEPEVLPGERHSSSSLWRMDYGPASGLLAAASASGSIEAVTPSRSAEVRSLPVSHGWVNAVAVLDDGDMVAAGLTDGTVRLVESSTGRCARTLSGHRRWVNDLALGRNGALFSISADRSLMAWSTRSGEALGRVAAHDSCIWCVAVDPAGTVVATGAADGYVKLWRAADLAPIAAAAIDGMCVTDLCWAGPNLLAATYSGDVHVLRGDLSLSRRLVGHRERVWTVARLADPDRCASASGDGTIRLWDISTGSELARVGFESMPISTAYAASIGALAVGHDDGTISWHRADDDSLGAVRVG